MNIRPTALAGVLLIEPHMLADDRGWFAERFRQDRFEAALNATGQALPGAFVQENHSRSGRGVLRGLHYQLAPQAQGKLVSVVAGEVFDVAVDVRPGSASFGQWIGVTLSAADGRSLWIPAGFAHGFLSLAEGSEVLYKVTAYYSASHERALRWDDPAIGIRWPAAPALMSARDAQAPGLHEAGRDGQLPV
ncbi:dTDP-4-dehydrorhamnose 3,5-epimerase [Bordetella holmesii]|uniref:dTDP-4-dehydrorhamnose 3,5-epimerase n=2 Tax=Bordetella holmesii TaxID=35814 RepID=A0A158M278_9BORD|nr:dTDP-4-dehydrorhamnose 3,5-epimerase [Bordetella holmesii]AHV91115.1 dTDP-4-dehydrorhamnose 3,5-epimerase [Bordetella holmesii ATCC 51541]AIT25965.1 dTDP-4-dehydrorhamnose 3,5-epimerase [Bordetella holmesii 44057]EWM42841.1 dTDP-4-dehydrorhamnose 3,5-epimerase [Bordetella holmesii 41130]EWM46537.1 dTDP-4-dehydrorhamnose 3,5-epimerase [Bordetella holmesii 35009]EWM50701.1 dTDP-4-dehydrorhamnose 3,5-epimerase [Bordetella holmesii 70147]